MSDTPLAHPDGTPRQRREFFHDSMRGLAGFFVSLFEDKIDGLEAKLNPWARLVGNLQCLRPPGALAEPDFLARCTQCNDCIKACPRDSIVQADDRWGAALAGFPVIMPDAAPCIMCDTIYCIDACATGALEKVRAWDTIRLGRPQANDACLNAQGKECRQCVVMCPIADKGAITMHGFELPQFHPDVCTGCGICVYECPADAITVSGPLG